MKSRFVETMGQIVGLYFTMTLRCRIDGYDYEGFRGQYPGQLLSWGASLGGTRLHKPRIGRQAKIRVERVAYLCCRQIMAGQLPPKRCFYANDGKGQTCPACRAVAFSFVFLGLVDGAPIHHV